MKYLRLEPYGINKDPFYFATEKWVLENLDEIDDDVCFLWNVYGAVIIGKHQVLEAEVNLDYLNQNNIPIYRRPSGGGAVYSDEGCIKYSFISKTKTKDELYKESLIIIKDFLKTLGLDAVFSGRNDLTYQGFKFSGNAYYQTKDGKVLHGTILYDSDLNVLTKVLNPNKEKLASKGVKSVKSRVTNLKEFIHLDEPVFRGKLKEYLDRETLLLKDYQLDEIREFQQYFSQKDYIYNKQPAYNILRQKRYEFGVVSIYLTIKDNRIDDISIKGDFFFQKEVKELEKLLMKKDLNERLKAYLESIDVSSYIEGLKGDMLYQLLKGE